MSRMLTAALAYAAKGWAVFPCRPGQKVPATKHGCKDATTDAEQIRAWWERTPDANVGVATGSASGIFVLDVDGEEGLDALVDLGHGVPGTLTQGTPSGGYHFVFADPYGVGNSARKLGPNLDTRGDGGYILTSPSVHPNGGRYRWIGKGRPAVLPGWLLLLVRPAPQQRATPKPVKRKDLDTYVRAALEAERDNVANAPQGVRNHTLNAAAFSLGTLVGAGVLDSETVYETLLSAASACGLGDRESHRTIASGLSSGIKNPREVA